MGAVESILMRTFGLPTGVLGRLGGIIMARSNRRMAQRVVELLDVQPSDKALEIGFGPGVAIEVLRDALPSGFVAGIDPSDEMFEQASARNAAGIGNGKVDLRLGSIEALPYESGSFDKILAINSMQVWPDARSGLREAWRVLRTGGQLVLGFTRHSGQGKDGLPELVTETGFRDVRLVEFEDGFCLVANAAECGAGA